MEFIWIVVYAGFIVIFIELMVLVSSILRPKRVEKPIVERPIVETPVVERPIVERQVFETPVVETPIVERPIVEAARPEVREPSLQPANIVEIEGIGPIYGAKLIAVGIKTTSDLLEAGATRKGRKELSDNAGISPKLILGWVNRADLFRIRGVGEEYSDLLEEAGVDTVVELSLRNPENLHEKLLEVNEEKKLVRRPPGLDAVTDWIEQAKKLPRVVEY